MMYKNLNLNQTVEMILNERINKTNGTTLVYGTDYSVKNMLSLDNAKNTKVTLQAITNEKHRACGEYDIYYERYIFGKDIILDKDDILFYSCGDHKTKYDLIKEVNLRYGLQLKEDDIVDGSIERDMFGHVKIDMAPTNLIFLGSIVVRYLYNTGLSLFDAFGDGILDTVII